MHNITYIDFSMLAQDHLGADISIRDAMISQMSERMAVDYDRSIMALIEKRLGSLPADLTTLKCRLERHITRGTGYETLLLDGRPFARVYEAQLFSVGCTTTFSQVIEEIGQ